MKKIICSAVLVATQSQALTQVSSGPISGGSVYKPVAMPQVLEVPDITGDGVEDLLVGYPAADGGVGVVYVFEGPTSISGGYLPLPESAVGSFSPIDGVTSFGTKIQIMSYEDGVFRPTVLVGCKRFIDGVLVDSALHVHVDLDYTDYLIGGFVEPVSSSHFASLTQIGLLPFDPAVAPWTDFLISGGDTEESLTPTPDGEEWEVEIPGYRDILNNNGFDTPGEWLRFQVSTYNAIKITKTAGRAYGWSEGQKNAFQHAMWMGGCTKNFGSDVAEEIGDHHETFSEDGQEGDTAADLYNNEVARQIMEQCLSEGKDVTDFMYKIIDLIHSEDGTFITDPNDPRIQEVIDGDLEIEDIEVSLD